MITDLFLDEWEHFLYVGKVAFVGWALHYLPFLIMGRVTYIHHYVSNYIDRKFLPPTEASLQLPTLYFSILMFAHLLDHFIFTNRRLPEHIKWVVLGTTAFAVVACFWWFRGLAFGVDGPIKEHKGLLWRKVRYNVTSCLSERP